MAPDICETSPVANDPTESVLIMTQGATVTMSDVSVNFDFNHVLRRLHGQIAASEFVAIVGRSGSGKSTLLRLISGLQSPNSGILMIDDEPVRSVPKCLRMVFQEGRLLPWLSVIANVELGLRSGERDRAMEILHRVGLHKRSNDWPFKLSGGQRQRVALARALAAEPRLLLLDEPLGSLDALTRIEMQRLIETLWLERQFTALLITHDVEEAVALADRVLLLEEGRITGEWQVPIGRPRPRASAEFVRLTDTILRQILKNHP